MICHGYVTYVVWLPMDIIGLPNSTCHSHQRIARVETGHHKPYCLGTLALRAKTRAMATDSPAPLAMAGTSSGLGSSSSDPNGAEEEAGDPMPLLRPSATTQATVPVSRPGPPISLRARLSSLSDYPSGDADSLVILDELLDDIRRSRTASLSSTPTLSSDCENESVIQCDEGRRSEAELRAMGECGRSR